MTEADVGANAPLEGDEVLLRLIAERNEAALAVLYETRSRLIYSLALSIVHQAQDAEEVTADVFVRVWEKAHTFRPTRGNALAWLVTLTRRLAIDRTRSKLFKAGQREADIDTAVIDARQPHAPEDAEQAVRAREILAAMEQLDEPYREIIRLSYFEGLSHAKIAEQLGTPLGTVKSRLREGVIRLRRILGVEEI